MLQIVLGKCCAKAAPGYGAFLRGEGLGLRTVFFVRRRLFLDLRCVTSVSMVAFEGSNVDSGVDFLVFGVAGRVWLFCRVSVGILGLLCLAAICGAGGFKVRGFSGFLVGVGSEMGRRISPVRPRIASASSAWLLVFLGVGVVAFSYLALLLILNVLRKSGDTGDSISITFHDVGK